MKFFDVMFGQSLQAKLDGIAGQAVTIFAVLHQVSLVIPSQSFGWRDFLDHSCDLLRRAPHGSLEALQRHQRSLPVLNSNPDILPSLLKSYGLRNSIQLAKLFAQFPGELIGKLASHSYAWREEDENEKVAAFRDALSCAEVPQEGLCQWLKHFARDLMSLMNLLTPIHRSDKITAALDQLFADSASRVGEIQADVTSLYDFVLAHSEHWVSTWFLSSIGNIKFANISALRWVDLVTMTGSVLDASLRDFEDSGLQTPVSHANSLTPACQVLSLSVCQPCARTCVGCEGPCIRSASSVPSGVKMWTICSRRCVLDRAPPTAKRISEVQPQKGAT